MKKQTIIDCNFFCILESGDVRKILLTQKIIPEIREIFVTGGAALFDDVEEIVFDGNYNIDNNEILYVKLALPDNVLEVADNPIGIADLDLASEDIKTLFWYEDGVYYFQNFDKRKLLKNRSVIFYSNQTYDKLENNAFVVETIVNAVHKNERLYFVSYSNANKIFSLAAYYQDATDEEIRTFSTHASITLDQEWFITNTNSIIRKQITLLQKSKTLDGADTKKIKKHKK
ncbi:MAG: hypothetical protein IAE95_11435 [Chitinophagaceae bacterium]|nr:hypothetical protein [Chitinophagaceae bacterium]